MDRQTAWQLTKSVTWVVFVLCLVLWRVDLTHIMILPRLRQTERLSHSFLSPPAPRPPLAASTLDCASKWQHGASNSPLTERRGEQVGEGESQNKSHAMQTVKKKEPSLPRYGFTAQPGPSRSSCLQKDRRSYPACTPQPLRLAAILAGCCTFKPPVTLSNAWLYTNFAFPVV